MSVNNQELKLKTFVNEARKIYVDKSFQRDVVWDNKKRNDFIKSLNRGWAHSPIVVAAVDDCRQWSIDCLNPQSEEKFQKILNKERDGCKQKFISLDGQNRTDTIVRFFNNKFTITGNFINEKGEVESVNNKYYRQLSESLQTQFRGITILFQQLSELLYDDLSEVFRNMNEGTALNAQEKRNSFPTPIAEWIRYRRKQYSDVFKKCFASKSLSRMEDGETLARFFLFFDNAEFAEQGSLNALYRKGIRCPSLNSVYSQDSLDQVDQAMEGLKTILKTQDTRLSKSLLWCCFLSVDVINSSIFEITDPKKLINSLKDLDTRLEKESEIAYGASVQQDPLTAKDEYYFHWKTYPRRLHLGRKRQKLIFEEIKKDLGLFGVSLKSQQAA